MDDGRWLLTTVYRPSSDKTTLGAYMEQPLQSPKIVEKPWGREIWYAHTDHYAGKVLEVKAGQRLSLQKHEIKEETLYLLSGKVVLTYGDQTYDWQPDNSSTYLPARYTASRP